MNLMDRSSKGRNLRFLPFGSLLPFFRKLQCRLKGHDWIVQTTFNPPPKFQDGMKKMQFTALAMAAVLMGIPEFGTLLIGRTDVERICTKCGRYEKGFQYGETSEREAAEKVLR